MKRCAYFAQIIFLIFLWTGASHATVAPALVEPPAPTIQTQPIQLPPIASSDDGIVPIKVTLPPPAPGQSIEVEIGEVPEGAAGIRAIVDFERRIVQETRASNPNALIEATSVVDPNDRAAVAEAAAFDQVAREVRIVNERIPYWQKVKQNLTNLKNDSLDSFAPYARRVITFLRFSVNGTIVFAGLVLVTNTGTMAAAVIGITAAAVLDGAIMGALSGSVTRYTEAFNLYLTKHNGRLFSQAAFLRKWIEQSEFLKRRYPKVNDFSEIPNSGVLAIHAKWVELEILFTSVLKGLMAVTGFPIEAGTALINNILFNSTLVLFSQGSWSMYANTQYRDRVDLNPHLEPRYRTALMIREFFYSVAWATILMSGQGVETYFVPFLSMIDPRLAANAKIVVPLFGHAVFGVFGYYKYIRYMRSNEHLRAEALRKEREVRGAATRATAGTCETAFRATGS